MSEVIVRMEMPKRCYDCDFANGLVCMATGGVYGREVPQMTWIKTRPSWCPIVGVLPEQHGDLIDRDAYLHLLESYIESKRGVCENKEFIVALQAISKQIKCVEAVIKAERKDDERSTVDRC